MMLILILVVIGILLGRENHLPSALLRYSSLKRRRVFVIASILLYMYYLIVKFICII
jgi:hypothetical protein